MLWYRQAGTPVLDVSSDYDAGSKKLTLTIRQSCKPTPGQPTKKPLHIPFAVGLLDGNGKDMIETKILSLKKPRETFVFENIGMKPVLSLLRDFSAPARLNYDYTDEELLSLLAHDSDPFSKWEAGFKLATKRLLSHPSHMSRGRATLDSGFRRNDEEEQAFIAALGNVLRDKKLDPAFKAMALSLPGESELGLALQARGELIDVDVLYAARKALVKRIAHCLRDDFIAEHARLSKNVRDNAADGATMGRRGLKNLCLSYLAVLGDPKILKQVFRQATGSKNMTDKIAALGILAETNSPLSEKAFAAFKKKWKKSPPIMDKWLAVQAGAKRGDVLKTVRRLTRHPAFTFKNPNRISALIGVFAGNGLGFHARNGSGYRFIADMILKIDPINPHSAAALAKNFTSWRNYTCERQRMMQAELKRLSKQKKLSANTQEVVGKSLKG